MDERRQQALDQFVEGMTVRHEAQLCTTEQDDARSTVHSSRSVRVVAVVGGILAISVAAFFMKNSSFLGGMPWLVHDETPPPSLAQILAQSQENIDQEFKENIAEEQADAAETIDQKKISDITVVVLNGGAAAGSAGRVRELLLTKGFKNVAVGNSVGDYTGTRMYIAPDAAWDDVRTGLDGAMGDDASVTSAERATFIEERTEDVVIVLGKATAEAQK